MKTAPHFVVGLTALAALSAGAVLAVEDRALFDPKQAMLLVPIDDGPGDATGGTFPTLTGRPREGFTASGPTSPVVQPFRQ
jgi:hypothetical protein